MLLPLLDGESEKQTPLCRTIEIKMPTIANEKISFEVKFIQYIMYFFPELQNCEYVQLNISKKGKMAIQIYTWTQIKVNQQHCYIDFFISQ